MTIRVSFVILLSSPLFGAGLVPVGTQPRGGLSGKIVYTHGGHGYTADNEKDGKWDFQRGPSRGMDEDLGNIDQMVFLVDYLFRAGATVVPLRPVGYQTNEVVLDNNDAGVTFKGDWSIGTGKIYYGKGEQAPYRQAAASKTETAYARFTPNIPADGFYPVYAWTSSGPDRATDQLYRVNHAGGATEVTVNHRRVGNGLVYLGTYFFEAGTKGSVDISNRSNSAGSIVVADMIRFGNGMGDISRGEAGISKRARQDEAGLYWVVWHVDRAQGIEKSDYRALDSDRQATISLSPRYAAFMNREADGRLADRAFVSFHSNSDTGKARGTFGLLNGNNDPKTATPHQLLLAKSLALEVNNDLVAMKGQLEHDWYDRGEKCTMDRTDIEFGEINNLFIKDEFDATIIEVAFHDHQSDAELLRDPRVRDAVGRATYKGLIKYFRALDNNETPATVLPPPVTGVHAESNAAGSVTISWEPPKASPHTGDAATTYRVYASTNGYGFDGGTAVTAKDMPAVALNGFDAKLPHYFKVAAVNDGGESPASEVVAALPSGGAKQVLIVNGFDRLDRTLDPKQTYRGKTIDRVRPRESNSRDYVVQAATAIQAAAQGTHVASSSNEAVISGAVNLTDYKIVVWMLGKESTADHTFDPAEQEKVAKFIAGGGNLFVTGSDIGFDLDEKNNGRAFFQNTLKGKFVADSAKTYEVTGAKGGVFEGLKFSFDNGKKVYDVDAADVFAPQAGAKLALEYANGAGGAGIQAAGGAGRGAVVMFGFPFETITTPVDRAEVMRRVLGFFHVD